MKKSILVLLVISLLAVVIYACKKESNEQAEQKLSAQLAFDNLNTQITILNTQYPGEPETRGPRWRRFWRIFGADLLGAAVGGGSLGWIGALVGGINSSVIAATVDVAENPSSSPMLIYDNKYLKRCTISGTLLNDTPDVGVLHNKIINEIYKEKGDAFYTMTPKETIAIVVKKVRAYYNVSSYTERQTHLFVAPRVSTAVQLIDEESFDACFAKIIGYLPSLKNELSVIKTYCEKLSTFSLDSNKIDYTNSFISTVDKSTISIESKSLIVSAIGIGGNSSLMWHE